MEILAEVVRSGVVESRHRGSVVRTDPDGEVAWSLGDPHAVVFPRSCNKPLQVLGMLEAGLPLEGRLLALASSSHSGEDFHLDGVREILSQAGLGEEDLQTPPSYPLSPKMHADWIRRGGGRMPICMDCSAKHAAMLATCEHNGWPTETYLDPEHPVQRQITSTFTERTGAVPSAVGVDGCGAPLLATSLARLSAAIGGLDRGAGRRLVEAAVQWPVYLSGHERPETQIMAAIPGSVAKSGAEACFVVRLPDGSGVAAKIEDGGARASGLVMARALEIAGYANAIGPLPVWGGGQHVGEIRPMF